MVSRKRMIAEFTELTGIDSLTFKERKMADRLLQKLAAMGLDAYEDDAGEKIGGDAGNIICTVKGRQGIPALLFMAHMDTVAPGIGKKAIVDGDFIRTDGTTVLGGDDAAGIECILEMLRILKEDGVRHGDMQVVFSAAEEGGLIGAKNLDYTKIYAEYGFIMDSDGNIGNVAVTAPAQDTMDVTVTGKAAHAGIEPEKGINAIKVAAEAISGMKLGRIDSETTANIGVIDGGLATNIICEKVMVKGESRSRSEDKLEAQTAHMKGCFQHAADANQAKVEFDIRRAYPSFCIDEEDRIIGFLKKAAAGAGVELRLLPTGGGSDTNIVNSMGITAVDLAVGMEEVHSVNERLKISNLVKAAEFLVEIVKAAAEGS